MHSDATTVEEYLAELTQDRRSTIDAVRWLIREHLPDGYEEGIQFGMISWYVPLAAYPDTYNGKPLAYVSLASQKNYVSLYLMCVYTGSEDWFRERWATSGKKLDMGKSCVRFKSYDDLDADTVAAAVERYSVDEFVQLAKDAHGG